MTKPLLVAQSGKTSLALLPGLANRRGLIAGATGTGKTTILQRLAQDFSLAGHGILVDLGTALVGEDGPRPY